MVDWANYPISGRTQWFAGSFCQRPCGVGYGYVLQTTNATGLYAQFNVPLVCITDLGGVEVDLNWKSLSIPVGFIDVATLNRKVNPISSNIEWNVFIPRDPPGQTIIINLAQTIPNLRFRFATPPAADEFLQPIDECPSPWNVTPMTREQVIDYLST